jgi:riboflavin synthase
MFTGIVEELGLVQQPGARLSVRVLHVGKDVASGDSMCVNGVCLTVVERQREGAFAGWLAHVVPWRHEWLLGFDLSPETLARSSLSSLGTGDRVNLERPATLSSRLGGHLVQGHVDGVGRISEIRDASPGKEMRVTVPDGLGRYLVEKGSIAVDGVSLTVTDVADGEFGVALVPYTLEATTLGTAKVGDPVNLEVDVIAKYVEGLTRGMR